MSVGRDPARDFRRRVSLWLYSALLTLLSPLYLLKLVWRGRVEPLYRHALRERFAIGLRSDWSNGLWVHAVSLGETRAAEALITALRERHPGLRLLLTHGTATGREAGKALLREGDVQAWCPYDTPGAVGRFLTHFRPAVGVLMETEIWPNLLNTAARRRVPMVLANARLSARSQRRGESLSWLLRPAAESLSLALAQTEADAERLRASGVGEVRVAGNLKFDMAPNGALLQQGRAWRALLARPVMLAAVTREGEEALLLKAWLEVPDAQRGLLMIVPRHPQRFDEVEGLVKAAGLRCVRRSRWTDTPSAHALEAEVWLGDTMGEMPLYYASADVALLGGSFAPLGGQNLIEAAACGCPVVMGPHTFNFREAAELSLAAGASLRASSMEDGVAAACALLHQTDRAAMSQRAQTFAAAHRGAAQRMAAAFTPWLGA